MYYSNIQILINGKSRENVLSGQRSRGFRDGHCRFLNIIRKSQDLYLSRFTDTLLA